MYVGRGVLFGAETKEREKEQAGAGREKKGNVRIGGGENAEDRACITRVKSLWLHPGSAVAACAEADLAHQRAAVEQLPTQTDIFFFFCRKAQNGIVGRIVSTLKFEAEAIARAN